MPAIETEKLRKEYKDITAVDGLDLRVEQGELFALLGVNGAGKTTTIKMLSCLCRPTSGDALLNGKSIVRDAAAVKAIIGVSPQETAVAPNLTVKENLELMCGVHGFSREKQAEKTAELSGQFGLDSVLKKKPGSCPADGSAGSASPWPSSASRRYSFWTSRRWALTCWRGATSGTPSAP